MIVSTIQAASAEKGHSSNPFCVYAAVVISSPEINRSAVCWFAQTLGVTAPEIVLPTASASAPMRGLSDDGNAARTRPQHGCLGNDPRTGQRRTCTQSVRMGKPSRSHRTPPHSKSGRIASAFPVSKLARKGGAMLQSRTQSPGKHSGAGSVIGCPILERRAGSDVQGGEVGLGFQESDYCPLASAFFFASSRT